MPLNFGENLFQRRDVRETPAGSSTSTSSTSIIAPIGSIMAWLKTYANTPQVLPTGWMEADGSAINDADSVYNGQNAPDLNGGEFIRGAATSGGTGGSDTINNHAALNIANDSHTHNTSDTTGGPSTNSACQVGTGAIRSLSTHTHETSDTTSQDTHDHNFSQNIDAHSTNLPSYYNVVWIFRFK